MTNDERRRKIFDLYASNWMKVRPRLKLGEDIPLAFHNAVWCPLCLGIFNIETLDQQSEIPLTLEHLPPLRLGGKPRILTCKVCNNESGRLLDHKITEHINAKPFLSLEDGSEILGTTSFRHSNGKKINSRTIIRVEDKNRFIFKAQIEKGEWREEQLRNIDPKAPIAIDFQFSAPSIRHVHIGLLRIAYLIAFQKFGHAFILNEAYNAIRQQILEPNNEILEPFGSMFAKRVNVEDGIYATNLPFNCKSFLVVFTLKTKREVEKVCIFLPSPFVDAVKFYEMFKTLPSQNFSIDLTERFLDVDFLNDDRYAFAFKNAFR